MTMDHHSTSEHAEKRHEAGEKSPLQQMLKIAALAVQARISKGDNHATLSILREARVLTREWADHAAAELSRASSHGHGHGKEERRTHGSKAAKAGPSSDESPLALLARLALMGWKVFRARGEERVSVKLDALSELHQILILRLEDADREIRRLERALGLRRRRRRRGDGRGRRRKKERVERDGDRELSLSDRGELGSHGGRSVEEEAAGNMFDDSYPC